MTERPTDSTLAALAAAIRARTLSPVEVVDACLARIEALVKDVQEGQVVLRIGGYREQEAFPLDGNDATALPPAQVAGRHGIGQTLGGAPLLVLRRGMLAGH